MNSTIPAALLPSVVGCASQGYTVRVGVTDICHKNNSTDADRLAQRLAFAIERAIKTNTKKKHEQNEEQ